MKARVLCIDDEPAILRLLGVVLARGGFETMVARDARSALALLREGGIDLVLLDLGLPDRDGQELLPALRAIAPVPVVVVSARNDVEEKVTALDLGAADYVTKPFDGDELLARIRAALRKGGLAGTTAGDSIVHGALRIDQAGHSVTLEGRAVALTPKEFALLATLAAAGGRLLTHAALLEAVWGKAHRDDVEYLRVAIRALRLKLEADPAQPKLILNEPGIGYRLAPAEPGRG